METMSEPQPDKTRLLIVDDDPSVLDSLAASLELEGFLVTTAASAELALAIPLDQTFDVILSDVRMSGVSGIELFRRFKVVRPGVPVVLMTAFVQEALLQDAIQEGVYTVLAKPVEIEHVTRLVSRARRNSAVLVVDDAEPHARSLAAALEATGLRAKPCFDGPSALEAIQAGEADICVADLVMPGMDGARLLELVRSSHPEVPVIVFSGQAVAEAMSRVASRGAAACFQKPVDLRDLIEGIARARRRITSSGPPRAR